MLKGTITLPGDKSISHRSVMLGALAEGRTVIHGMLRGDDCLHTVSLFRALGIDIMDDGRTVTVSGRGLKGLRRYGGILDVGNSGTTIRLVSGILAGQNFKSTLTGDSSIQRRPMKRIIDPLTQMGSDIHSVNKNGCAPLAIAPATLRSVDYESPVASAQVKSCILLAGLYADGKTTVREITKSRDHTERMLKGFGATVESDEHSATVVGKPELTGCEIRIPGDISSAAFFIVAGLIVPGSDLYLRNVGVNPTRTGILDVCEAMGAAIERSNERVVAGEPVCDLHVRYTPDLHATVVTAETIPRLVDEIPVLAVLAACAEGTTVFEHIGELRHKESDRIAVLEDVLTRAGITVAADAENLSVSGGKRMRGVPVTTFGDHRIAMSFVIASLISDGEFPLDDPGCVNVSYPGFFEDLQRLQQ